MGVSIDADIVFGEARYSEDGEIWPWDDEGDPFYSHDPNEENGFEYWLMRQAGLAPLDWDSYPDYRESWKLPRSEYEAWEAQHQLNIKAWEERVGYEEYRAKEQAITDSCPFLITWAGNMLSDVSEVIVYLKKAHKVNAYYSAEKFNPSELHVPQAWVADAQEWAREHGFTWEPSWLLVPSYG